MNTLKLRKPLLVNGKELTELTYDTGAITAQQFCDAERFCQAAQNYNASMATLEFDHSYHLYIGFMAIIAVNSSIDVKDIERIKGFDVAQIMKIGQNFILAGMGESSDQKSLCDTSETMPEPSTQAQAS